MADSGTLLKPGQLIKPKLDEKIAIELVRRLYGFTVIKINELNAYDDKNYHVICERINANPYVNQDHVPGYVLKILNSLDSRNVDFVEAQNEMMLHLNQHDIRCTLPVRNLRGSFLSLEKFDDRDDAESHVVRLLMYQPGVTLYSVPLTTSLLLDVGRFAARLESILGTFSHPAYESRTSMWSLNAIPKLRDFAYAVSSSEDREIVLAIIRDFENKVLRIVDELDRGIIHGDLNEQNLLVESTNPTRIIAVIDFGDSYRGCLVYELAIAICYMIVQARDLESAKYVIQGFRNVRELKNLEKRLLKICVCARLSQSLTLGAYSHINDPQNPYILVTQKDGWEILRKLWSIDEQEILKIWGLADSPENATFH